LAQFIIPHKSYILFKLAPGAKQTTNLYDTTAITANQFLASSMSGALTPEAIRWFVLKMVDEDLNDDHDIATWLEDCATRIFSTLNHSNFHAESHEFYLDLGCFGTAAMLCEEIMGPMPFNGLRFRTQPWSYFTITEDSEGRVDTVGRNIEMTARTMRDKFGLENLHPDQQRILNADPDKLFEVVHYIAPNPQGVKFAKVPQKRAYYSYYVSRLPYHFLRKEYFFEQPWLVARWGKSSGEIYGRGPGHVALPDIKTINKARELRMRYAAKVTDPPLAALDDSVIGRIRSSPAAVTAVRSKDALTPLFDPRSGSYDVAEKFEGELQQQIRAVFYSDLLKIPEKQYMTATEVQAAQEQIQRALGPTIGRLKSEFLAPLIDRVFGIMLRAGAFLDPPPSLVQAQEEGRSTTIEVSYEGPLSRSQRYSDISAIERGLQLIMPIIQVKPTTADVIDSDETARYIWEAAGNPMKLLNDDAKVKKIRDAQHQAMQDQQAHQQAAETMGAIGKMAPAVAAMQKPQEGATPSE
jgi:hypothetical protein